jgi:hypothetical protein
MFDSIVIAGALVAVATLAGPTLATKFAPEIDKIKADAEADVHAIRTELLAIWMKAENDVAQAKLDSVKDFDAMKTRAESAEAVLARFLPSGTPGTLQAAPVAATPASAPAAAVVAAGMAPVRQMPSTTTQLTPAEQATAFAAPVSPAQSTT